MSRLTERFEQTADNNFQRLSRPAVAFTTLLFFAFAVTVGTIDADPDLFARVAVGKLFSEVGFTTQDPFAFSPKKPVWVDHEWLAGVVFYHTSQIAGDLSLLLLKLGFIFCMMLFLFIAACRKTGTMMALCICSYLAVQCSFLWATTIRSQLFTYLFLAYLLFGIRHFIDRGSLRMLYALPLCMAIWIQAHGGFVVGLGFLGIFGLWILRYFPSKRHEIVLLGLATGGAALISPYGTFVYWDYILHAVTMERPSITEWHPVNPLSGFGAGLLIPMLVLGFGLYKKTDKNREDLLIVTLLLLSIFYGFKHQRLAAIFCFVAASLGSEYVRIAVMHFQKQRLFIPLRRSCTFVLSLIIPFAILFSVVRLFSFEHLNYDRYPLGALIWLQANAKPGNVLVDFNAGSFAIWQGYPNFLVSIDGRYEELYEDKALALTTQALNPKSPDHTIAMKTLKPDYIVLDKKMFAETPDYGKNWHLKYDGKRYSLLVKGELEEKYDIIKEGAVDALELNMWQRGSWAEQSKNE